MKFLTLLLCISAIVCPGANGASYTALQSLTRMKHTDCHESVESYHSTRAMRCKPRQTLVKLEPDSSYTFLPDIVSVNRCEGYCMHPYTCVPTQTVWKAIRVDVDSLETSYLECYEIMVEEHTKCKCGCDIMPEQCNDKQIYSEEECSCICMSANEEEECRLKTNMKWDPNACRCVCGVEEMPCSTGFVWISSMCGCGQVLMMDNKTAPYGADNKGK